LDIGFDQLRLSSKQVKEAPLVEACIIITAMYSLADCRGHPSHPAILEEKTVRCY
jgi:hypothetical protein